MLVVSSPSIAQEIADPCFASISPLGKFNNSENIVNLCGGCFEHFHGANLLEWDGSQWEGAIGNSSVTRPPPEGCNSTILWMGYRGWTPGGEAVAFRLTKPLKSGETYTFGFTYAKDGFGEHDPAMAADFSPIIYTDLSKPYYVSKAYKVGRLPGTVTWKTDSITFTATAEQEEHQWLIVHGLESSGSLLSDCVIPKGIQHNFVAGDTTVCIGSSIDLNVPERPGYTYHWNNGESGAHMHVDHPGVYSVLIKSHQCEMFDSVNIQYEDCELLLTMPNVFSPNGDGWNDLFLPKEYNYIDAGTFVIFNRWGREIYRGDIFEGWNGKDAPGGIYFYSLFFLNGNGEPFTRKGIVTLMH